MNSSMYRLTTLFDIELLRWNKSRDRAHMVQEQVKEGDYISLSYHYNRFFSVVP
jgi:hypothetical protein